MNGVATVTPAQKRPGTPARTLCTSAGRVTRRMKIVEERIHCSQCTEYRWCPLSLQLAQFDPQLGSFQLQRSVDGIVSSRCVPICLLTVV
ncbi:hypothetical protein CEXT_729451 [Caerostris extrusa]|uniref:Uncharacterized protein n=1 Tax=Caerostris extrusa TaxID=172846 RepID=A0AAV4S0J1_CAEEX|nr:hypothetical protein CEXT_729451 [Caerostris extrusa]